MKTKNLLAIGIITILFACGTENNEIKNEVNSFKTYADSLLAANTEYVKGADTTCTERPKSDSDPDIVVIDTTIQQHSNLLDSSSSANSFAVQILNKYNTIVQHLDSAKAKMDSKTLELYESIKQKIEAIKAPVK